LTVYYLDTSALVKLYLREPGTDRMMRLLLGPEGNRFAVSAIARLEFTSAVWRLEREGQISSSLADVLLHRLAMHWRILYAVLPVSETVLSRAASVLDRHPLTSLDAVQLAASLTVAKLPESRRVCFVSSDVTLLKTAAAEGLPVWNPATEDLK
jgi:hypothetical protein